MTQILAVLATIRTGIPPHRVGEIEPEFVDSRWHRNIVSECLLRLRVGFGRGGFAHGPDQAGIGRRSSQILRSGPRSPSFVVPVGFPAVAPGVHESTARKSGGDADLAAQGERRSLRCSGFPDRKSVV